MKNRFSPPVRALTFSAVCLALCLVLPFVTGQLPRLGKIFSPMHLPALLCGFLCGPWWAAAVGLIAPLLRGALFHAPVLYPTGVVMSAELCCYGLCSGLFYRRLPQKPSSRYLALLAALLAGRIVWGAMRALLSGVSGQPFTWALFFAGAFTNALPGIAVEFLLLPPLVSLLERAGLTTLHGGTK